jgi:hypothetical protein
MVFIFNNIKNLQYSSPARFHLPLRSLTTAMVLEKADRDLAESRPGASTISSDSEIEGVTGSPVNEKALLRKLDLKLLPAVSVLYLLSFLDRSNGTLSLKP